MWCSLLDSLMKVVVFTLRSISPLDANTKRELKFTAQDGLEGELYLRIDADDERGFKLGDNVLVRLQPF